MAKPRTGKYVTWQCKQCGGTNTTWLAPSHKTPKFCNMRCQVNNINAQKKHKGGRAQDRETIINRIFDDCWPEVLR